MNDIVGVWRLVRTSARNDAGETMHPPYGEKPRGLVVFYSDKRMMSVLCDGRRELSAGEETREYNSYCGNYEFDGKTLVTRVDASAAKDRVGGRQTRFVHFDGDLMVLTQKPRLWQGVMQHRELAWERIADAPGN
jgi:Lipocalin-like domain